MQRVRAAGWCSRSRRSLAFHSAGAHCPLSAFRALSPVIARRRSRSALRVSVESQRFSTSDVCVHCRAWSCTKYVYWARHRRMRMAPASLIGAARRPPPPCGLVCQSSRGSSLPRPQNSRRAGSLWVRRRRPERPKFAREEAVFLPSARGSSQARSAASVKKRPVPVVDFEIASGSAHLLSVGGRRSHSPPTWQLCHRTDMNIGLLG